jgi:epoxyqueuosine reductase
MSNDAKKIEFFGTLMPALMLIKASPVRFAVFQINRFITPRQPLDQFIATQCDDAGCLDDTLVFVHRWESITFDPFTFARAKTFLDQLARLLKNAGFRAEPITPLSPSRNLPKLGALAGLGNLSPYGLLVHPIFGPRLILTGMKTDAPLDLIPRWGGFGCNDCLACVKLCPQKPIQTGEVHLRECQSCAKCLVVCPTGKGKHEKEQWRKSNAIK